MEWIGYIGIGILVLLVLLVLVTNIQIVQQSRAYVVERLGAYSATWGVGLHFKIPFFERVVKKVSLKEQVADFDPQPVITKDNVTMQIDTVIYFQITDPKLYTYGVEHPMNAIENLTATTLRNIIGEMELDQSLTSRDVINAKMRSILDEATDPWGIKVNRVELKNILPPREIQNAMEKQMKAERERRESILQAEGQKQSQILVAEGEKQSTILRADAEKQAAILKAKLDAFIRFELDAVNQAAAYYTLRFGGIVETPVIPEGMLSSWAQYTIRLADEEERNRVMNALHAQGIPTMIYYRTCMSQQHAFEDVAEAQPIICECARALSQRVLSLPISPYITTEEMDSVIAAICRELGR